MAELRMSAKDRVRLDALHRAERDDLTVDHETLRRWLTGEGFQPLTWNSKPNRVLRIAAEKRGVGRRSVLVILEQRNPVRV